MCVCFFCSALMAHMKLLLHPMSKREWEQKQENKQTARDIIGTFRYTVTVSFCADNFVHFISSLIHISYFVTRTYARKATPECLFEYGHGCVH